MVISPAPMRYTPQITMPTVTAWVTSMKEVTARLLYLREMAACRADASETCSQRVCIRLSAMQALMVSSPLTISTSRAFFCMFCL